MRKFLVRHPQDGRLIDTLAQTAESLRADLAGAGLGYTLAFEVVDGVSVPPLPDGLPKYSLFTHLIREHGDELREWINKEVGDAIAASRENK